MSHPGNRRLRSMMEQHKESFQEAVKRAEKRRIAADIIREIQNSEPPGRFLMECPRGAAGRGDDDVHGAVPSKTWVRVDHDRALTKVMHRLRERETSYRSGPGHQMEMRKHEKKLAGQKDKVHFSETEYLATLTIDEQAGTDANITDSA